MCYFRIACFAVIIGLFLRAVKAEDKGLTVVDPGRPRVIVLTDMGNEPDDSESMVRFLLYTNEMDVEGLIATTSRHLPKTINPQLISERLKAYGQVRPNLLKHNPDYPSEE